MKIACPGCGLSFPLEAGINDADARRFSKMMGDVPPVMANQLLQYLLFFKPKKQGLRWNRAVKLLGELVSDITNEKIKHQGRAWSAPPALWVEAMVAMQSRRHELDLPMNNHHYLYKIIAGLSDKIEAAKERQTELARQSGQHVNVKPVDDTLSRLKADQAHFESMLEINPDNPSARTALNNINERIKRYRP